MNDDNIRQFRPPAPPNRTDYGTEFVGPMVPEWKVVSCGYKVPYLRARLEGVEPGTVLLVLDGRIGISGTTEEVQKWVPFVADAMAIAAGQSCFGPDGGPMPLFKTRIAGIAEITTEPPRDEERPNE